MNSNIANILNNASITIDEKVEEVINFLYTLPDRGVEESIQFILNTNDPAAATYPANYLALLPNLDSEKRQVVEHTLNNKKQLMVAATNLIKEMPGDVIDQIVAEYLKDRSSPDIYNLIFEVAQHFPEHLHNHVNEIQDEYLKEAMLPGGLDQWVEDLVNQYREDADPKHLKTLAYFRTNKALDSLLTLLPTVPEEDQEEVVAYIESSGVFPDTRFASTYVKNYHGYIVSREESSHLMGGHFPHPVPKCPFTDISATRILTLDRLELDLGLESLYDPTFFWYEGSHPPDYLYVQFTENGTKGLMTPMTDGEVGTELIPGELALKLEEFPRKRGRGGVISSGFSNHQVGGYPPLIWFERFPKCPICVSGMNFLVSIDSGMTPFGRLGFDGTLYGFWCDSCSVSCTHRQMNNDYCD